MTDEIEYPIEKLTTKAAKCPHCNNAIQFEIAFRAPLFLRAVGVDRSPATPVTPADRLESYLSSLDGGAVLDAYAQVMGEVFSDGQRPKDLRGSFRHWLSKAEATRVPRWALDRFKSDHPLGHIDYIQTNGIGAVLSVGRLVQFVPHRVVVGIPHRAGTDARTSLKFRTGGTEKALDGWCRTRYGYVKGNGALFDELRDKKSFGDFAR